MECELLPAVAVAVAALPRRARLRHLQTPGPAAPNKDGGGACGIRKAGGRGWPLGRGQWAWSVGRGGPCGEGQGQRAGGAARGAGPPRGAGGPGSAPLPSPRAVTESRVFRTPGFLSPQFAEACRPHVFVLVPPKLTPPTALDNWKTERLNVQHGIFKVLGAETYILAARTSLEVPVSPRLGRHR